MCQENKLDRFAALISWNHINKTGMWQCSHQYDDLLCLESFCITLFIPIPWNRCPEREKNIFFFLFYYVVCNCSGFLQCVSYYICYWLQCLEIKTITFIGKFVLYWTIYFISSQSAISNRNATLLLPSQSVVSYQFSPTALQLLLQIWCHHKLCRARLFEDLSLPLCCQQWFFSGILGRNIEH